MPATAAEVAAWSGGRSCLLATIKARVRRRSPTAGSGARAHGKEDIDPLAVAGDALLLAPELPRPVNCEVERGAARWRAGRRSEALQEAHGGGAGEVSGGAARTASCGIYC